MDKREKRLATEWWRKNPNETFCPFFDVNDSSQLNELLQIKTEFYGRFSRIISQILDRSFDNAKNRGELGLCGPNNLFVNAKDLKGFNDLESAVRTSLFIDAEEILTSMRTKTGGSENNYTEFIKLAIAGREMHRLNGISIGDINSSVRSGIHTATSQNASLLGEFCEYLANQGYDRNESLDILIESYKPIMRLASSNIYQLAFFNDRYAGKLNELQLLIITAAGRIDFRLGTDDFIVSADSQPQQLRTPDSLGCPIILGRDQLKKLWQWHVLIADKASLF